MTNPKAVAMAAHKAEHAGRVVVVAGGGTHVGGKVKIALRQVNLCQSKVVGVVAHNQEMLAVIPQQVRGVLVVGADAQVKQGNAQSGTA